MRPRYFINTLAWRCDAMQCDIAHNVSVVDQSVCIHCDNWSSIVTVYVYDRTSTPWRLNFVPSRHFWRHLFCHQSVSFMNLKHSNTTSPLTTSSKLARAGQSLTNCPLTSRSDCWTHLHARCSGSPAKVGQYFVLMKCRCLNPQNNLPATNLSRTNISHK